MSCCSCGFSDTFCSSEETCGNSEPDPDKSSVFVSADEAEESAISALAVYFLHGKGTRLYTALFFFKSDLLGKRNSIFILFLEGLLSL